MSIASSTARSFAQPFAQAAVAWSFFLGIFGLAPAVLAQTETTTPTRSLAHSPARVRSTIVGQVLTTDGDPVADAVITLVDLKRRGRSGSDGGFRFDDVPPGSYLIDAESPSSGNVSARVVVAREGETVATLRLALAHLHDEVVVSAGATAQQQLEVAQPTNVLSGEELDRHREATLGETLAQQPGVSSTYFGPGASRPVIRGLGGDRVRMLSDGLGSADASNVSPDHAVSIDPLTATRIEVLRGPSTLLYGSTAIGGVVNVLDGRIPEYVAEEPLAGEVTLGGSSVASGREGAISLGGGAGHLAWHADYLKRQSDDYAIPGRPDVGTPVAGKEHPAGKLPNTASDSEAASVGVSLVGDAGLVGIAASGFDTFYGVPNEEDVKIDLEQRRLDLKADLLKPFGAFDGLKVRLGRSDYEHRELEGGEIGTRFLNDSLEGRVELVQKRAGRLSGSFGAQVSASDFAAIGEEAFVPPATTDAAALFAFEELKLADAWRLQLGGRYERQRTRVDAADLPDRDLSGLSGSLGVVWEPSEAYSASIAVARSVRLPTSTELYAKGPHVATGAFEIGDPAFGREASLGVDVALRKRTGRFTATLSLFANDFTDYVFERFTDETADELRVVRFEQRDARFRGAELEGLVHLFQGSDSHFDLTLGADTVRAELTETGEPLPRIPPQRFKLGLDYHLRRLRAYAGAVRAARQDRVSADETPTDGYTLLDAGVSYRFFVAGKVLDVLLRGRNLTDAEARNHVSFLKDIAPLPGRDVGLSLRLAF